MDLSKLQKYIVNAHNEKRNQVAGGQIANHSPAVRMATIQWDKELAELAGLNIKTCNYGHDQCRNTKTLRFSGQNLAKNWWYGKNETDKDLILGQIDSWFNEHKDSDMTKINSVGSTGGAVTGHFTVMVTEPNIKVGCASARSSEFMQGHDFQTFTTACNYAHTNIKAHRIYRAGKAASECKTGTNPKYPNLCSINESYDPNTAIV